MIEPQTVPINTADAFVLKADEVLIIQAQFHATLQDCVDLINNIPEELRKRVLVLRDIKVMRNHGF